VVEGLDPGSLDRTLQKVEALSDYLEPLLKNPQIIGGVSKVLSNLDKASIDLNSMIGEDRGDLRVSVSNLKVLTGNLRQTSEQIKPVVVNAGKLLSDANTLKVQQSLDSLNSAAGKVDAMMTHIQDQKGILGVLVYDDATGKDLRQLLGDLKRHPWKLLWKK
jgi:phospholipid/cholesterol/gamma-HCH transport system substrate-binding protein